MDHPAGSKAGCILPHPNHAGSQVHGRDSPRHVLLHLSTLASPTDAEDVPIPGAQGSEQQIQEQTWLAEGSPEVRSTGANPGS